MNKIDAHQHFWHYNPNEFSWIDSNMQALRRDYLPTDLTPLLQASGIDGTICVQARQSHAENDWLLELADQNPFILAVVGWADLCDPRLPEHLKELSVHAKLRGIRYILVEEADDQFMLRNDFVRGISCLAEFGLTYDLLICPRHLPVAYELVRRFPKQSFVVDHIALPSIKNKEFEPWARHMKLLADCQNLYCKISGMVTEADWENWSSEDFFPYLDVVFESFGTKRILLGSDWPVCTLAGGYAEVLEIAANYLSPFFTDQRADVWGNNARTFYGI